MVVESPSRTRGTSFGLDEVEAGFWLVLGVARGRGEAVTRDDLGDFITDVREWARGAGAPCTISASEFERTRRGILDAWGQASAKGRSLWPPTSRTVATRLGNGHWNEALAGLGLTTSALGRSRGASTFGEQDFLEALRAYIDDRTRTRQSVSFAGYEAWAGERRSSGVRIPAAATIRQRFGSWSRALACVRDAEQDEVVPNSSN